MFRLSEEKVAPIKLALSIYFQNRLKESGINKSLKASCFEVVGKELDEVGASTVIIDALWRTSWFESGGMKKSLLLILALVALPVLNLAEQYKVTPPKSVWSG